MPTAHRRAQATALSTGNGLPATMRPRILLSSPSGLDLHRAWIGLRTSTLILSIPAGPGRFVSRSGAAHDEGLPGLGAGISPEETRRARPVCVCRAASGYRRICAIGLPAELLQPIEKALPACLIELRLREPDVPGRYAGAHSPSATCDHPVGTKSGDALGRCNGDRSRNR